MVAEETCEQGEPWRSVRRGGFFDCHPILVPATAFFVCWIPYLVIFFRKTIAFGDLGNPVEYTSSLYWLLFAVQLGVCVISHSLTIRTIVRLYAPRWLIYGSMAFFCLSPAWGLLTAADIRHPLFAAVFCVFVSSLVFVLYSPKRPLWLWIQLGLGALCVCLLREEGAWSVFPTLVAVVFYIAWAKGKTFARNDLRQEKRVSDGGQDSLLHPTPRKKRESYWSDVFAAFLTLSAVILLFAFSCGFGAGLPLGQPDFGAKAVSENEVVGSVGDEVVGFTGLDGDESFSASLAAWNLTGTFDVAGMLSFADIRDNSLFPSLADSVANVFWIQQCLPVVDLTFSWVAYLVLFAFFAVWAIRIFVESRQEWRPLILALPMIALIVVMVAIPENTTLRYLMPVLAAQPMFFAPVLEVGRCKPVQLTNA